MHAVKVKSDIGMPYTYNVQSVKVKSEKLDAVKVHWSLAYRMSNVIQDS